MLLPRPQRFLSLRRHLTRSVSWVRCSSMLLNKHYLALLIPYYVTTTQARAFPSYVRTVGVPSALGQLRNKHLVSAAELCLVCVCVFFKGHGLRIYLCMSCGHIQISLFSWCVQLSLVVTWSSGLPVAAADNKWTAHPASPQLPKYIFYIHSQEEADVHMPTRSATHTQASRHVHTLPRLELEVCVM